MSALQVEGLKKTFRTGQSRTPAVRGISITIEPGEVLGFLGPNGAGKTTAIKMISGLIRRDDGTVSVAGRDPERDRKALGMIGAVLEGNRNLYWRMTAMENLEYFGVLKGMSFAEARAHGRELLTRFSLKDKLDTQVRMLSRGMQQKVALAVSLVHRPRLLLLDEPTLGLDVETAETVKLLIREVAAEGCAVLLTTHQLGVAEEISDRLAIIMNGQIVVHEATGDLLRRFSGEAYRLEIDGKPTGPQIGKIEELGGVVSEGRIDYMGDSEKLYEILAELRPLPLVEVRKDRANLTAILLKLTRESAHA